MNYKREWISSGTLELLLYFLFGVIVSISIFWRHDIGILNKPQQIETRIKACEDRIAVLEKKIECQRSK